MEGGGCGGGGGVCEGVAEDAGMAAEIRQLESRKAVGETFYALL